MLAKAPFQPFFCQAAELGLNACACGQGILREEVLAEGHGKIAFLGYAHCVFQGLGSKGKFFAHLFRRLVVQFVCPELEALGVRKLGSCAYAQKNIVRFHVICIEIVAVVGGNNRNAFCLGKFQKLVIDNALLFQAVVLQLKVVVPVKELAVAADHLPCNVHMAGQYCLRYLALQAG